MTFYSSSLSILILLVNKRKKGEGVRCDSAHCYNVLILFYSVLSVVACHTVLHFTVLYCVVLLCTMQCHTMLHSSTLHSAVSHCPTLHYSVLYYAIPFHTTQRCTMLPRPLVCCSFCSMLYCALPCSTIAYWIMANYIATVSSF